MSGLEIALLVFGLACVIISFFIVDNNERVENGKAVAKPDTKAFDEMSKRVITDTNNNAEKVLNETEEKLEALSNDKIMAVGEYSDQILEKIDTNHKEVVFLYQMLKDKEEELKATASELENVRIECEKLIREKEALSAAQPGFTEVEAENATSELPVEEEVNKPKSKSLLNANSSERQYGWGEALAIAEEQQGEMDSVSERNQEIIALYKKKKSVLEISKLLGMGQGEVKLVIDLYCK